MAHAKHRISGICTVGALACVTFLIGCAAHNLQPAPPTNAQAPAAATWLSEACLLSTDKQIDSFIDGSMRAIVANRNAAAACNGAPGPPLTAASCPPGTYPDYCGGSMANGNPGGGSDGTKAAYNNWLGYVAGAIRSGYSPIPPGSGQPSAPYEGLGQQYLALSQAAQTVDQQSYACVTPDGTFHPPGSSPCGHDVLCMQQQVEAASFLNVGEGLFLHFRGCSSSIRTTAAQYLESRYAW